MTTALSTQRANPALALMPRPLADMVSVAHRALEARTGPGRGYELSAARSPSPAQRQAMELHRDALVAALAPCTDAAVIRAVGPLFVTLASERLDDDSDKVQRGAYCAVLRQFPAWAVNEVCLRFLDGREGNGEYVPKPAQLAKACRLLVERHRAEALQIEAVLSATIVPALTEAERAEGKARADALLADLAAAKDMRPVVSERPKPTEAERLRAEALLADLAERKQRRLEREAREAAERGEAA